MRHSFAVEVREAAPGRRRLHGVMVREGRAATGGRAELFAPGSISTPAEGVGIQIGHHTKVETRAQAIRNRSGEVVVSGDATPAIVDAIANGARWLSVEFHALEERTTIGGVREILAAFVPRAALVSNPEYQHAAAEVRSKKRRLWL